MHRFTYLLAFLLVVSFSACASDDAPETEEDRTFEMQDEQAPPEPEDVHVEDTEFADELNVDVSAMTETESGLYYRDLEEGSGAEATAGDEVFVRYTGWLPDGTQFDSNADAPDPFTFRLGTGAVIPGFDEGVTGMQVEGRRQVIIPPELGYGVQGAGPIPPNSILVFDIELENVEAD